RPSFAHFPGDALFFFSIIRCPPRCTLFPYTTLFRSSSAPVLQTPKATSSTLYFDSLTVNAGNGGFLHCIQMDTSVNAANQVDDEIGRAVQQECRDRSRMPSSA